MKNMNIGVDMGSRVAIVGPNGAGASPPHASCAAATCPAKPACLPQWLPGQRSAAVSGFCTV
jgi:ABC-type thiamine transport system ATPase subunit